MALEVVQPGVQPLGQFDGYDGVFLTVKGGEVATLVGVPYPGTDKQAYADGYVGSTRPAATTVLASGARPLFLVDDGISGYGTLFGSVIGGTAGQFSNAPWAGVPGTQLGPHSAYASGKLTLWDKPGTYAVTLDAVDTDATTGLVPTNATLAIGAALYATDEGLLTPNVADAFENVVLGRFLNFESWKGGSLVTTPVRLVSAANSPVGLGQPQAGGFSRALITFNPPA